MSTKSHSLLRSYCHLNVPRRKLGREEDRERRGEREIGGREKEFSSVMEHWVYLYPRVVGQHKLDTIGLRETKEERTIYREKEHKVEWAGR